MNKDQRTEQLRAIMVRHKLNAPAVAKMLKRSAQTVRSWTCANDQRAIPEHMLDLLNSKLPAQGAKIEQA